jgi:deoxycytidylate deaminase
MDTLADALIYAIAYLNVAHGEDDRQDDDCRALESIMATLTQCAIAEQQALVAAVNRAIAVENAVEYPNHQLLP